jgi:SAM-dependent methyltransferase
MVTYPDEPYYRAQYWYWIEKAVDSVSLADSSVCLDLGCGQGRLTAPIAQKFKSGSAVGIDFSATAIATAKKYADKLGIANVDYRVGNIHDVVRAWPSTSVDLVLMTEVTFFYPHWREDLIDLKRILKPGGLLGIAFRSQYYDMLNIIKHRMWDQVDLLLNERSGPLYGDTMDFTWQKSGEVSSLFGETLDMGLISLVGIGCCSGIEYDPHACIVRPSKLEKDERERLMKLELSVGAEIPDAGRYMLAIARKQKR